MKGFYWTVCLTLFAGMAVFAAAQAETARSAPELHGNWSGALQVGAQQLRLVLEVSERSDVGAVLVSVDQGGARIPVDALSLKDGAVEFSVAAINGSFKGKLDAENDQIEGQWSQNGVTLPLLLKRSND